MSRATLALAPAMLLATGGFASSAEAAHVYTDTFGLAATYSGQGVLIGTDLLGGSYGAPQYEYRILNTATLQTILDSAIGVDNLGNPIVYSTPGLPDAGESFRSGELSYIPQTGTSMFVPVKAAIDGTNISTSDAYLHLKFGINGATYLGTAHFDVSDHTTDDAKLVDVSYTAAAVPEPATWAELIGGLGAVGGTMRAARRRKAQLANA